MKDVTMKVNTKQMNYRIPWKKARKKLQKSETHYFWNENWQEKWKKTKLKVRKQKNPKLKKKNLKQLQVINKLASAEE